MAFKKILHFVCGCRLYLDRHGECGESMCAYDNLTEVFRDTAQKQDGEVCSSSNSGEEKSLVEKPSCVHLNEQTSCGDSTSSSEPATLTQSKMEEQDGMHCDDNDPQTSLGTAIDRGEDDLPLLNKKESSEACRSLELGKGTDVHEHVERQNPSPGTSHKEKDPRSHELIINLLACCERFFVDELKTNCEFYLVSVTTEQNVVDHLFAALRHNARILKEHAVRFMLVGLPCPMTRTRCFAEVLFSHEKDVFLEYLHELVVGHLQRMDS